MTYDNTGAYGERIPHPCQPGVTAFQTYFTDEWGLPSLGCYNPASTLPGGGPSLHTVGRAVDVGHDWSDEQINLVWHLARQLAFNAVELGVQQIIYRGLFFRQGQGWRGISATTDPHESHAHVEFTVAAAGDNTFETYTETLEGPPMTDAEILKLATEVADQIMNYPVDVHDYDANSDRQVPLKTLFSYELAELSQIRKALTAD